MSTKCSIVYLDGMGPDGGDIHLYRESFDREGMVYLSVPTREGWRADEHALRIAMFEEHWDKLVDAYVEEREKKRRDAERRRKKISRCLRKYGDHDWEEVEGVARLFAGDRMRQQCSRCGAYPFEGPSELERLADAVEDVPGVE